MKFIIDITILCDDPNNRHVFGTIRKELECEATPIPGIKICDTAWKDSKEMINVELEPSEGYYYIAVEPDHCESKDQFEELKSMYKSHGWKVLGEH